MICSGSESSRSRSSSRGIVNMWCIGSMRLSSSFHTKSGKSVTQHIPSTSVSASPRRSLKWSRSRLRLSKTTGFLSATKNNQSPSSAPSVSRRAACCFSEKNFATGLFSPFACTRKWARPLAPPDAAHRASRFHGSLEDLEFRVCDDLRDVLELQAEADVRLICTEAVHRLGVSKAGEGVGEQPFLRKLLDDSLVEAFD